MSYHCDVDHPSHYLNMNANCSECGQLVECIDVTRHMNFNLGNAIKYIWRSGSKGDAITDLKKAVWYLNDQIKMLEEEKEEKERSDAMIAGMSDLDEKEIEDSKERMEEIDDFLTGGKYLSGGIFLGGHYITRGGDKVFLRTAYKKNGIFIYDGYVKTDHKEIDCQWSHWGKCLSSSKLVTFCYDIIGEIKRGEK